MAVPDDPTGIGRRCARRCRWGRPPQKRRSSAPAATDMFAPTPPARRQETRQRPRSDAENFGGEVSWHPLSEMAVTRRASFRLDVGRLDDRPPLIDLSLVEGSQSLRRFLLARHNLVTQVHEAALAGRWSRQSLDNRCVELADDVLRRALWSPNCTP